MSRNRMLVRSTFVVLVVLAVLATLHLAVNGLPGLSDLNPHR
jgi:preprotein translocase subunit SecE